MSLKTVNNFKVEEYNYFNDQLLVIDQSEEQFEFEERLITGDQALKYRGNFYGLLNELKVEPEHYLTTLYVNKLTNPVDYEGKEGVIKITKSLPIPRQ